MLTFSLRQGMNNRGNIEINIRVMWLRVHAVWSDLERWENYCFEDCTQGCACSDSGQTLKLSYELLLKKCLVFIAGSEVWIVSSCVWIVLSCVWIVSSCVWIVLSCVWIVSSCVWILWFWTWTICTLVGINIYIYNVVVAHCEL